MSRLVAVLVALELGAGVVGVIGLQTTTPQSPLLQPLGRPPVDDRAAAVQQLLAERAAAVATHDRSRWLATVDPRNTAFRAEQARVFGALQAVPLAGWSYDLDASAQQPVSPSLDKKRGERWWVPGVTLHYRLAGFDSVPTSEP